VIKAPYTSSVAALGNSATTQGCAHTSQKAASWSKLTGVGTYRELAKGSPCAKALGSLGASSTASAMGSVDVGVPIPAHLSGAHMIVVHWNVSGLVAASLTVGTCLPGNGSYWSCYQQAGWYIDEYTVLVDLGSGTTTYASNYWSWYSLTYNSTSCFPSCHSSSGSSSYGRGGAISLYINATLNKTHHYAVGSWIGGYADVSFTASYTRISGGSGSALLDLASPGYRLTLTSVTVT
jgi:hypothetical protein